MAHALRILSPGDPLTPPSSALRTRVVWAGVILALAGILAVAASRLIAQVEGDRGIAPVAVSSDIQIGGIEVNVTGKDAQEARQEGWKRAAVLAWEKLGGAKMGEDQINAMVSAIIIEREQIGPRRYGARLGVIFDRTKAGQFIATAGGSSASSHSAPMLLIPVLRSGGTGQVYEVRGAWQAAWAMFQDGTSPIDYVRPSGAGGDSLLINAGQPSRRSRLWWRTVLDRFDASDVLIAEARLDRQWPGGPVRGTFTARYGPDNTWLETFALSANDETGVPAMLEKAVRRMDDIYSNALAQGLLAPDPTLNSDQSAFAAALDAIRKAIGPIDAAAAGPEAGASGAPAAAGPATQTGAVATYTVQFASPDAAAVDAALSGVRGAAGVQGAATTSIAIGGTSVMRVTYAGDIGGLAAALRARGFSVSGGGSVLVIRR